jgi:formylmethanofuran dehydrogenase subunit B
VIEITEVPSPFCGIGTDDLTIQVEGLNLKVVENGCAVNTAAFEQPITELQPRVNGKEVSLAEAVNAAAALLREANQPVIGGCATDVSGMRALLALADKNGAVVDHINFNAARRNYLAMQDSGWMNTTLAELKNRCDVMLIVGTDLESFAPRFFQRYLWNHAMFLSDSSARQVIYLGKAPSGKASTAPNGAKAKVLECADDDLPQVLAVLRALIKGRIVSVTEVGGIGVTELQAIADVLKSAQYGVVTWSAAALGFNHAELTVQTVCEMVKDINTSGTRCSGFPLGGKEGDQTANQVCGWTTGYPARMRFSAGMPEYDPFLYDCNAMLSNGEADALVWVQAFNSNNTPPETDVPMIVLGRSGMTFAQPPAVFIPVATPGIDHAGHAYRLDNIVAIRLKKLRDSTLPATADVLAAIEQLL